LIEFIQFIDASAKTPSFLKGIDRAKIEVDDTFGAYVFESTEIWPSSEVLYKR
jgi:hypothetical protein